MIGLYKDNFLYIKCPKNGCMTYTEFLSKRDWKTINLFDNDLDLKSFTIFGHLTEPNQRHTKGLEQYLRLNPDINLNDPVIAKMLMSGVFDEHTYSLNMMLGPLMLLPINWIPLDVEVKKFGIDFPPTGLRFNGDDLTNDFFKKHNLKYTITAKDRVNITPPNRKIVQEQINQLKEKYSKNYKQLVKNFLEPDILLYNQVVEKYIKDYETD